MDKWTKLLDRAMQELGYLEKRTLADLDDKRKNAGSANFTKYWRDLKPAFQGQPWCNAFVNWCFEQSYGLAAAKQLLYTPGDWSYYTPTSAGYFQRNAQWFSDPRPGDVIYFKNDTRICHVGIVHDVTADKVYTIEGNTNNTADVVENGGGVYRKCYLLTNDRIAGYGRPDWSVVPEPYVVGWHYIDGCGWWYADTPASYLHDTWATINHSRYYFNGEGYAVTGLQEIDGKRYVFEDQPGAPKECALMYTADDGALYILTV